MIIKWKQKFKYKVKMRYKISKLKKYNQYQIILIINYNNNYNKLN